MSTASIEALGWTLVHFLWQGALVALVLEAVLMALRDGSARHRYLVRCAGLALMAALPLGTYLWLVGHPTPGRGLPLVMSASLEELRGMRDALGGGSAAGAARASAGWTGWVVLAWALGASLFALRVLRDYARVRRIQRVGAGSRLPADWQERFRRLALRMGVEARVRVIDSAALTAPTVIGWLRPIVLIPARALSGLSERELELVLAHELAHIRRHDYLVNLAQSAVEALLFYHPAVWWVSNGIRTEREFCCDDAALDVARDGVIYARALATLEGWRSAPIQLGLSTLGGPLMTRIQRLVGVRTSPRPVRAPLVALGVLVLVGGATAFSHGTVEPQDRDTIEALRRQIDQMETQLDQLRALLDQAAADEHVQAKGELRFSPRESQGDVSWTSASGAFDGHSKNVWIQKDGQGAESDDETVHIVVSGPEGDPKGNVFVVKGRKDAGEHHGEDDDHEHFMEELHEHLGELHGKHADRLHEHLDSLREKDGNSFIWRFDGSRKGHGDEHGNFSFDFDDLHGRRGGGSGGSISIGDHADVEIHIQTEGGGAPQTIRKRIPLPHGEHGETSEGLMFSRDGKRYEFKLGGDGAHLWRQKDDEDGKAKFRTWFFDSDDDGEHRGKRDFFEFKGGNVFEVEIDGEDGDEGDRELFFHPGDDDDEGHVIKLRKRVGDAGSKPSELRKRVSKMRLPGGQHELPEKVSIELKGGQRAVIMGLDGEAIDLELEELLPRTLQGAKGHPALELDLSDLKPGLEGLKKLEGVQLDGKVKILLRDAMHGGDVRVIRMGPDGGDCTEVEVDREDCEPSEEQGETKVKAKASGEIV